MEECPICGDELKASDLPLDGCSHRFCFSCITKHLRIDPRCPSCRHLPEYSRAGYEDDDEFGSDSDTDYENLANRVLERVETDAERKSVKSRADVKASVEYKRFKTSETKLDTTRKLFASRRKQLLRDGELRRLRGRMTTLRHQCVKNEVKLMEKHSADPRDDWHAVIEPTYRKFRDVSGFYFGGLGVIYGSESEE